jgi:hypothetical protein
VASKGFRVLTNWKGNGSVLATVAGSALALATNASAGIIYSGVQNIPASLPVGQGANSNGFTVGGSPWAVRASNAHFPSSATARLRHLAAGEGFMAASAFSPIVTKLASGAAINGSQLFGTLSFNILRRKNLYSFTGQFLNSQTGFAGIKFKQGAETHYGWIRLHVDIGPGNAVNMKAIDWAYNDVADATILAGEGTAPEPSTISMTLLAAGAAGVLAWRKRRKQVAA